MTSAPSSSGQCRWARLDPVKRLASFGRQTEQLGALVAGVVQIHAKAGALDHVRDPLHALTGQVEAACDLRHRHGVVRALRQHQAAGQTRGIGPPWIAAPS